MKRETVLIPNYNGSMYIKDTLNVLYGRNPNAVVYFYNDGSIDDSLDLVMGYRRWYKKLNMKVFSVEKKRGYLCTIKKLREFARKDGHSGCTVINLYNKKDYEVAHGNQKNIRIKKLGK